MDARARSTTKQTQSQTRKGKKEQETQFEGCELKKEREKMRGRKDVEGGRDRHEAFKKRELQQEIRAVGAHLH